MRQELPDIHGTQELRNKYIDKLEEYLLGKANTRHQYLSFVARLLMVANREKTVVHNNDVILLE